MGNLPPVPAPEEKDTYTYLSLGAALLLAVGGGGHASGTADSDLAIAGLDASPLGQVFVSLLLPDLDLLLLAAAAELVGLERALGLELRATVLGDVSLSHGD